MRLELGCGRLVVGHLAQRKVLIGRRFAGLFIGGWRQKKMPNLVHVLPQQLQRACYGIFRRYGYRNRRLLRSRILGSGIVAEAHAPDGKPMLTELPEHRFADEIHGGWVGVLHEWKCTACLVMM